MSKFAVTRTNIDLPNKEEMVGASRLLFKCLDGATEDARKSWRKLWKRVIGMAPGAIVEVEMVVPRNPRFHRKLFALLNLGYEAWQPSFQHLGMPVEKDFEQFREDVTILAGFYVQTWTLAGEMRLRAKSISFGSMDDAEFEVFYSAVVDVLLKRVLTTYRDRAELDEVVDKIIGFL